MTDELNAAELAQNIRQVALHVDRDRPEHKDKNFRAGVLAMANTALHLLGEKPLRRVGQEQAALLRTDRETLIQQVEQLKADRWVGYDPGSRSRARNEGEQNAFAIVLRLLRGDHPLEGP